MEQVKEKLPQQHVRNSSETPSTSNGQQYIKHKTSNGNSKIKQMKSKSKSIPILVAQELTNETQEHSFVDNNKPKTSSNVVYRSKSFTLDDSMRPSVNYQANRHSAPIETTSLHIKLPQEDATSRRSKPIASVQPTKQHAAYDEDPIKRRSAILNSKSFKSSLNLDSLTRKNGNGNYMDYDELFDPSIVFLSSFRCHYYDINRRIRKGKLLLSANELVFKCSGMPFVKAHLKYEYITKLTTMEQHENIKHKFLCIEYNHQNRVSLNFYFYHFLMPIKLVKMNIKYLIKKSNKYANVDVIDSSNGSSKIPGLSHLKSFILTNINKDTDNESPLHSPCKEDSGPSLTAKSSSNLLETSNANPTTADNIPIPCKRHKKQPPVIVGTKLLTSDDLKKNKSSQKSLAAVSSSSTTTANTTASLLPSTALAAEELPSVKKTTAITISLFVFMLIFIMINFFKLSELEREVNDYES